MAGWTYTLVVLAGAERGAERIDEEGARPPTRPPERAASAEKGVRATEAERTAAMAGCAHWGIFMSTTGARGAAALTPICGAEKDSEETVAMI